MSLHVILMGGPKAGTLHEVSDLKSWQEGDQLSFNVWPPLPRTREQAEDSWPDLPKAQDRYQLVMAPTPTVPGSATYLGRFP